MQKEEERKLKIQKEIEEKERLKKEKEEEELQKRENSKWKGLENQFVPSSEATTGSIQ